jgi:hypothetical protein
MKPLIVLLLASACAAAQTPPPLAPPIARAPAAVSHAARITESAEAASDQNDPGFARYKEGYALILNEQWSEARKKFSDLLTRFPDSEYADDAGYWSAYALMHLNREKGRAAYEQFIEAYPGSSYLDDAVADLAQAGEATPAPGAPRIGAFTVSAGAAPRARDMERELRAAGRSLRHMRLTTGLEGVWTMTGQDGEPVDQETQLKVEALSALGGGREDDQTFQTFKLIALDSRQPRQLREAAVDGLAGCTKHDPLPVLVEVAQKETSATILESAVYAIGQGKDRNRSIGLLIDLFGTLPPGKKQATETVFYAIAEVGNDRAVDFLKSVALTHKEYDLRRDAVYLLGNIGGERARAALFEILKTK